MVAQILFLAVDQRFDSPMSQQLILGS